jgi:hypothetical protein
MRRNTVTLATISGIAPALRGGAMSGIAPALRGGAMMWIGALLALGLSGCLTVDDDEGPILSIELFWDARPEGSGFFGGTCNDAGVRWMDWTLRRSGSDDEVASREELCADGIDVIDPEPGDYWLEITGFDEDDNPIWQASCPSDADASLTVLRFDVAYACDIPAPVSED